MEAREVFKDLTLRQQHLVKIRVNLAVAQSHLRITSVGRDAVFFPWGFTSCLPSVTGKGAVRIPKLNEQIHRDCSFWRCR